MVQARKALRSLKGLVRLQAIIRGRAVRRQAMKTLKCLQSVVNIQSQVCARRCQMLHAKPRQEMKLKVGFDSERRWDDQLSTEDEANASILTKTEALLWRERLRAYSFNNHRSLRKIRQYRGKIEPYFMRIIGNGTMTSVWHDHWHPLVILANQLQGYDCDRDGIEPPQKISSITYMEEWCWPNGDNLFLTDFFPHMLICSPYIFIEDKILRTLSSSGGFLSFSSSTIFPALGFEMQWASLVWLQMEFFSLLYPVACN
ncbi:hypothetical protein Nepgr_021211 [Nepenthes gracilis]|uniref:Uncharacterized protein n=1 Tax=Nepenthes gracilis TaxID=150966 RepID=A0AAD3SWV4_NEPGR|nr:hypothetical protein Nepgr_021211 [Nepenthes gracilis]